MRFLGKLNFNRGGKILDILIWLQNWYKKQCDGDWEHLYGITIDTLDNPGWAVTIDISGTNKQNTPFKAINFDNGESDWIQCNVENNIFMGYGDTTKLVQILKELKKWIET